MSCKNESNQQRGPWYKKGLHFECTGCGKCCTGAPGSVWVTEQEIAELAELLGLLRQTFIQKYVRLIDGRASLIEKRASAGDYDCIFLKDTKCLVYERRPAQCRTFPWWRKNLESEESWKRVALDCEGIQDEAPVVSYEEIQKNFEIYT